MNPFPDSISSKIDEQGQSILIRVMWGHSESEISRALGLKERAVRAQFKGLFQIFGVSSRPQLVALVHEAVADDMTRQLQSLQAARRFRGVMPLSETRRHAAVAG